MIKTNGATMLALTAKTAGRRDTRHQNFIKESIGRLQGKFPVDSLAQIDAMAREPLITSTCSARPGLWMENWAA
ncbi:hypothetical protein [Synechococcus sp. CS-1328]|uniref:hypothetical protein n=1 Tax=Synechococcus sp. CS-1328 TaxID=2847976 RepID=UPI00223AD0AE|nr:hypothetical protein [Synechococcus sp. CS-1328]MCT0223733.1 hypothetical protein [Synechococcus sp. CS-1328]